MKKLLIVLLALTVLGVFAFAQDEAAPAVQIKDTLGTGFDYTTSNSTAASPDVLRAWDYWNQGAIFWNTVDIAYASGDFNFFGEYGGEMGAVVSTVKIQDWRGLSMKGKFFGGMLAAEVGKTNNGDFTSLGDQGANAWGTGSGFLGGIITASPIPGLTVGFGMPLGAAATLMNSINGSQIGLSYSMDKMFIVKAEYLLNNLTGGTAAKTAKFNASFSLKAVENLTFNAEAWMSNIGDAAVGKNMFDVTAAYTMGALQPGVVAYATMYALSGSVLDWNVKPYVNYTIDKTTLTGNFKYINVAGPVNVWNKATNKYVVQALAKQAFDSHATAWVGIEYGDTDLVASPDVATFRVSLAVAYAF